MNATISTWPEPFVPRLLDLRRGVNEQTVEWNEHEHIAITIQIEAEKLLHQAGSPELAKEAIDSAERVLG